MPTTDTAEHLTAEWHDLTPHELDAGIAAAGLDAANAARVLARTVIDFAHVIEEPCARALIARAAGFIVEIVDEAHTAGEYDTAKRALFGVLVPGGVDELPGIAGELPGLLSRLTDAGAGDDSANAAVAIVRALSTDEDVQRQITERIRVRLAAH